MSGVVTTLRKKVLFHLLNENLNSGNEILIYCNLTIYLAHYVERKQTFIYYNQLFTGDAMMNITISIFIVVQLRLFKQMSIIVVVNST